jgi:FkbM family methyltransferase
VIGRVRRRAARWLRGSGANPEPHAQSELQARFDQQDAAIARLHLAVDKAVLALDRRILDHYELTELVRAQLKLRADAIELALSSPDGPLAELLAAESAQLDSYLIHHTALLRSQIEALAGEASPPPAGIQAFLRRELRQGASAVDVGSGSGALALALAAAVGPAGRVVCFEPLPQAAAALRRTLAARGVAARSDVREIALADTDGIGRLHVPEDPSMSSLAAPADGSASESIQVVRTTLDQQIPAGQRVDLVVLDVGGAEALVWRGAARVRRENPEILFLCAWDAQRLVRAGSDPASAMAEFAADGFSPFLVAADDPEGGETPFAGDPAALSQATILLRRS